MTTYRTFGWGLFRNTGSITSLSPHTACIYTHVKETAGKWKHPPTSEPALTKPRSPTHHHPHRPCSPNPAGSAHHPQRQRPLINGTTSPVSHPHNSPSTKKCTSVTGTGTPISQRTLNGILHLSTSSSTGPYTIPHRRGQIRSSTSPAGIPCFIDQVFLSSLWVVPPRIWFASPTVREPNVAARFLPSHVASGGWTASWRSVVRSCCGLQVAKQYPLLLPVHAEA